MDVQFVGDACVNLVFGDSISLETNKTVLAAYQILKISPLNDELGLLDLVPTYCSLAAHFQPGKSPTAIAAKLETYLSEALSEDDPKHSGSSKTILLPVIYDGVDLERIAQKHSLDVPQVIALHSAGTYRVAMVGFKPYFPYLIGLNPQLEMPRLDSPRTKIPAGSVAIGGAQTGIYPEDSPGGWNIVGRTDPELLKTIVPGCKVIFKVSEAL